MKKRSTLIGLFIKHWDISLFVIIFLGIIPVCLYILALTPSSKGFMFPEDARTWLTYYGAIAGGSMTLWGVAWSISGLLYTSRCGEETEIVIGKK